MPRSEVISSARNPLLKDVRRALSRGELTESGLCAAESFHLLEEALRSGLETPIVIAADRVRGVVERQIGRLQGVRIATVSDAVFDELSSTESAQGVVALVRPPAWSLDHVLRATSLAVVLDGIQDPGNAGSIARAAEAFGATGMIWLKGTVSPWNPKTLRASAGSLFRVPLVTAIDPALAGAAFTQRRLDVYIAQPRGGVPLRQAGLARACALVIGSEGRGVGPAMAGSGTAIHIPTAGVESLNASVAAGILLYEAWCQRTHS